MKPSADIHPQRNLELDFGFDSLERVELLSTVQETFQVQIPDESAAQIFTVEELVEAVEERLTGETAERDVRLSWKTILREPLQPEDLHRVQQLLEPQPLIEFAFYLVAKLVYVLSLVFFRLKVTGKNNLPHEYPYLICP